VSEFNQAITVILRHEGGWVNNPRDRGGETNFGISMRMIRHEGITPEMLDLPNLDPDSLKGLRVGRAALIYNKLFWTRFGYGRIADQQVATKIFDCSVNMGPGRAHILAQQAAIGLGQTHIMVDGIMGPLTVAAINACFATAYLQAYGEAMADFYRHICERNPTQLEFLAGWLKRAAWPDLKLRKAEQ
jgi:lysozyme family protein